MRINLASVPALSVRQPWAWWLFHGKNVENRSWRTEYRGLLLIHASKAVRASEEAVAAECIIRNFGAEYEARCPRANGLTRGGIVGVVRLVDCLNMPDAIEDPRIIGNRWYEGEVAWITEPVCLLSTPHPCGGRLGLFHPNLRGETFVEIPDRPATPQPT